MEGVESLMAGIGMIEWEQLVPRVCANTMAQFEPTTGLLVINATHEQLLGAAKGYNKDSKLFDTDEGGRQLLSTINHETYHYLQTICTGYQYQRAVHTFSLVTAAINAQAKQDVRMALPFLAWYGAGLLIFGWSKAKRAWWRNLVSTYYQANRVGRRQMAAASAASWAAASDPELFRALDELDAALLAETPEGLSDLSVIEGSAIVFQYSLQASVAENGRETLVENIENELEFLDDTYGRAYEFAKGICGAERAPDVTIAAAALALQYTHPAHAFPFFTERLSAMPPGEENEEAARLSAELPAVPHAGEALGTARAVRRKLGRAGKKYKIYESVLGELEERAWGLSEMDLLTEPATSMQVPQFPSGMVLRDNVIPGTIEPAELIARLVLASVILRTASLPKKERELAGELSFILGCAFGLIDRDAAFAEGDRGKGE